MKEIDGLIACSHYGVIEWLCTYDQTVSADVARKQSDWSIPDGCGTGGAEPWGPPFCPQCPGCVGVPGPHPAARGGSGVSRFLQRHQGTQICPWPTQLQPGAWGMVTRCFNEVLNKLLPSVGRNELEGLGAGGPAQRLIPKPGVPWPPTTLPAAATPGDETRRCGSRSCAGVRVTLLISVCDSQVFYSICYL